jgi:hypothetical protein
MISILTKEPGKVDLGFSNKHERWLSMYYFWVDFHFLIIFKPSTSPSTCSLFIARYTSSSDHFFTHFIQFFHRFHSIIFLRLYLYLGFLICYFTPQTYFLKHEGAYRVCERERERAVQPSSVDVI